MPSPFSPLTLPVTRPEDEDARLPDAVIDLGAGDDVSFENGAKKVEQLAKRLNGKYIKQRHQ